MAADHAGRTGGQGRTRGFRAGGLAEDLRVTRLPHLREDRAPLALAREIERRAPDLATSKWWKEERHGVFVDYNQNAKDRTIASAYSIRPLPDARVSTPLNWDEVPDCDPAAFTIDTVPARFAEMGDPWEPMDEAAGSIEQLLALADRDEAAGLPDAPWPPHFVRQEGEEPRVQPSKRRASGGSPAKGSPAKGSPAKGAQAKAASARESSARESSAKGSSAKGDGSGDGGGSGPTGRRRSAMPLIEIARAATKAEAMEGLERWKARHPTVWSHLAPADVLVDSMRGRSSTWTRIRLNLQHVPEAERPPQEPLEVDYDPWAGIRRP
jgi:bifunctional non-homologous end joining protein LigD